jgi:hypothetical protein
VRRDIRSRPHSARNRRAQIGRIAIASMMTSETTASIVAKFLVGESQIGRAKVIREPMQHGRPGDAAWRVSWPRAAGRNASADRSAATSLAKPPPAQQASARLPAD